MNSFNTFDGSKTTPLAQRCLLLFKQHYQILCLAFVLLVLHLIVVSYVKTYVADEGHYVPQANSIIHEQGPQVVLTDPTFLDHPALAKLFIATGILAFGDNPWGWRIPSVIFGVISVILFYFICKRLAGKRTAIVGSFLLAFENFFFACSGVAMLDVFSMTFMLSSFLLFLDRRYVLSGTSLALAGLCKLPGLFGVLVILGYWALAGKRSDIRKIGLLLVSLVVVFLLLMPIVDFAATSQWFNPIARVYDMLVRATSIKYSQASPEVRALTGMSYPWEWILSTGYAWKGGGKVYSFAYTTALFILIVPSIAYMAYELFEAYIARPLFEKRRKVALFSLLWFSATYVVWIPIALVTDRAMYTYYFLPTVGAICLAVGFGIQRVWQRSETTKTRVLRWLLRALVVSCLVVYVLSFLLVSTLFLAFADVFFHATLK